MLAARLENATPFKFARVLPIDNETAQITASEMERQVIEIDGSSIYLGNHPTHGQVIIIVPAMGESILLLPFESHDAKL